MVKGSVEPDISLPDEIDSSRAKLVYLYLTTTDEATITELQEALGLPKIVLFSILDSLKSTGLVQQTSSGYTFDRK